MDMKLSEQANIWLKRYISECSPFLPLKNRDEVKKELESQLWDKLEDRFDQGSEVSEEEMKDFLQDQGSPLGMAQQFGEDRGLLSPAIFPLFKLVAMILFFVLTGVSFFTFFFRSDATILGHIGTWVQTLFSALGGLVLVFWVMDRRVPQWRWSEIDSDWSPKELSPLPEQEKHSLGESIATWVFTIIFLVIFLGHQDKLGIWYKQDGEWSFLPVLAQGFYRFIPFWIIGALWDCLQETVIVVQKGWTKLSRSMALLKGFYDLGLTFFALRVGWQYFFIEGVIWPEPMQGFASVVELGQKLYPAILVLALIGGLVESIKRANRLLKA